MAGTVFMSTPALLPSSMEKRAAVSLSGASSTVIKSCSPSTAYSHIQWTSGFSLE